MEEARKLEAALRPEPVPTASSDDVSDRQDEDSQALQG